MTGPDWATTVLARAALPTRPALAARASRLECESFFMIQCPSDRVAPCATPHVVAHLPARKEWCAQSVLLTRSTASAENSSGSDTSQSTLPRPTGPSKLHLDLGRFAGLQFWTCNDEPS